MPNYVEKKCEICNNDFKVIFKKRNQKTCSKSCAYKLRKKNKNTSKPIKKTCISCKDVFNDNTKLKNQNTCKKCILKKGVETRKKNGSYVRTDEQNLKLSNTLKEQYASGERKFSEEALKKLSEGLKSRWQSGEMKEKSQQTCMKKYGVDHWTKSESGKLFLSKKRKGYKFSLDVKRRMSKAASKRIKKYKMFSFGNGGFREDIGLYVRSNWEANFARILKLKKIKFEYEPETFELDKNLHYTPDFKAGNTYFEIKGYMNEISKLKIDLFKKKYPEKTLTIVSGEEYKRLRIKYCNKINWEGK